jgi:hypothetical protein
MSLWPEISSARTHNKLLTETVFSILLFMENNIFHIIFSGPKPQLDSLHKTASSITILLLHMCLNFVSHSKRKHKLEMSENSVRRRMFGPTKGE